MAILTRIVAAATIASLAFADIAGASAAENYALAAKHARANNHHERAAHVNAAGRSENRKRRSVEKRCKANTSTSAAVSVSTSVYHSTTAHAETTTHKAATTTAPQEPAKTTSKAVQSSPAPPPPVKNSNGKKVLAWGGAPSDLDNFLGNGVVGIYNWGPSPPSAGNLFGMSQLWGTKSLTAFRANREKYKYLMGMNEFNLDAQANLGVADVVKLWNDEIRPFGNGRVLIAPSVTTAPTGISELQKFFDTCGGNDKCGADMVQAHVYGKTPDDVISYCTTLHTTFGLPVFLSEFSCQSFAGKGDCNAGEAEAFLKGVSEWAESTEWITFYAPFGVMKDLGNVNMVNALMSSSGKPTALGSWWLNL